MGQKQRDLTPEAGPWHRWGAELRALRNARNLSLAALSQQIHCDPSYLARLERAERVPPMDTADHCDRILDAGGVLVRLWKFAADLERQEAGVPARGRPDVASSHGHVASHLDHLALTSPGTGAWEPDDNVTVPARTLDGKVILVALPRRLLLTGAAGIAAGAVLGPAAPTRRPADAEQTLAHFAQMRRTLADSDNLFGPRQAIPAVQQQVTLMTTMQPPAALRPEWMRIQTEFADLAGWLHQDSGTHDTARHWLDRSLEWACQTGDPDDVVFMLTRKAQLALDIGQVDEARGLTATALGMTRPRSRIAAISATFAGRAHAQLGNQAESAQAFEQARTLLDDADADTAPWGQFFDATYITVWEAGSLAYLGAHAAAAAAYETAIAAVPPSFRRDSGFYLAQQAQALGAAHDIDQAVAVGQRALEIGVETGSGRIFTELSRLDTALRQHPGAAEFRDQLSEALPRQIT